MTSPYTRVRGREAVLQAYGDDPFLTCFVIDDSEGLAGDGAVAFTRTFGEQLEVVGFGEPVAAADLVTRLYAESRPTRMSVPQPVHSHLPPEFQLPHANRWHWFFTRQAPPPHPAEERCEWLGDDDNDDIHRLLDEAFPHASRRPEPNDPDRTWFGVRDDASELIACGVSATAGGRPPSLGSIAVHPRARRRGLAAGMTTWVTRVLLDAGHSVVALGSYVGEDSTHRIYRRLGYVDPHVIVSGRFNDPR